MTFTERLRELMGRATPGNSFTVHDGNEGENPPRPLWKVENDGFSNPSSEHDCFECAILCGNKEDADLIALLRSQAPALLQLAEAAAIRKQVIDMEEHNDAIFKGKWKKGAKAWSGEFIERLTIEADNLMRAALRELDGAGR